MIVCIHCGMYLNFPPDFTISDGAAFITCEDCNEEMAIVAITPKTLDRIPKDESGHIK